MPDNHSTKIARVCATCGKSFRVRPYVIKIGSGQFCSRGCYHSARVVPLIDRFFACIGRKCPNGCILWAGTTNKDGYGLIGSGGRGGRNLLANRVSYELCVGPIPDGFLALHQCDNPPCINPVHLFLGTVADNVADKVAKGRQPRGETIPWSKLTAAAVREIRTRHAAGGTAFTKLAAQYHVTEAAIRRVINRKSWKHV